MDTKSPSVGTRAWLTVPEVADELHIPRTRAYDLIQQGKLPGAVRIGERSIRVNRAELERFLLENRARGSELTGRPDSDPDDARRRSSELGAADVYAGRLGPAPGGTGTLLPHS